MGLFDFLRKKESSIPLFSHILKFGSSGFALKANPTDLYAGWIYACINVIADEVSQIDLVLTKKDGKGNKQIITDHPAIDLINRVNPFLTKHDLFERLQANKELYGNEYWFIEKNGSKNMEIYPLKPTLVNPLPDPYNYVSAYQYNLDGKRYNLPPENIIHFKTFNPKSDILGTGTIEAVRTSAETDLYAREYNKAFFENSAQPGVILEYPGELKKEDQERLKSQWVEEYGGFKRNFRTAVASNGLKIQKLEMSHTDMEFIEQRRFSRDEILSIFRVPKTILGILEDANFASAKTANYVFALRTILPKMRAIKDTLNEFYLPLFGDESLEFELRNPVPEDRTELVMYYNAGLQNGWLTQNEIRRMEGLGELEDGNVTFLPFSLAPASKPKESKTVEGIISKEQSISAMAKDIAESLLNAEVNIKNKEAKKVKALDKLRNTTMDGKKFEEMGLKKSNAALKRGKKFEKQFKVTSDKLFEEQKKRAIDNLHDELNKKTWKATFDVLDEDAELQATIDLFTPLMRSLVEAEGQAAYDYLGIDDTFDISRPNIAKFIKQNTKKLAGSMTQTTVSELRAQIVAGLEQSESVNQLTQRIVDYSGFNEARSQMIALTEVSRGQNQAEVEAWKESEIVASIVWYTALDERVDEDCNALHGKEVDLGDKFLSEQDLEELQLGNYDGAIEAPPLHPNCRCVLLPVVSSKMYEPKKKGMTDEQLLHAYLQL